MTLRIGVDIGGTFTDFCLFDDARGEVRTHKLLTTPHSPATAVLEGVRAICDSAGVPVGAVTTVVHGTTLVTNAIIERRGVPTAMLVTEGFRDTLEIALERRYDLFDLRLRFPAPVVPRNHRFEVRGRLRADGTEETPLVLDAALEEKLAGVIRSQGIEAIAICFLHSYVDGRHELAAKRWLTDRFPKLKISTSCEIFPFMREYERWTTTTLNAYVQPNVDRYLSQLESGLSDLGFKGNFLIMSSSGGTLTAEVAREYPIRLLESGPAAGALMAAQHGRTLGEPQVLSFDMGGTTAKGCIVQGGEPLKRYDLEVARTHEFKKGSGLPAKIPVIDMIEIGAGGGSLATIGERGTLEVGPRSAGADPGPACYARGGTSPTLTDANLILGYLSATAFLGGRMGLDVAASEAAVAAVVATPLSLDTARAAWGIHEVINEDVARAFRIHASERGIDYRRCSMVVFGGSGPIHGARVARKLKIPKVICPSGAGVMSAFGLLTSPLAFEVAQSNRTLIDPSTNGRVRAELDQLGDRAASFLARAGLRPDEIRLNFRVDARYLGQGYELEVPIPDGAGDLEAQITRGFNERYEAIFGMALQGRSIEVVNWKVEAIGPSLEGWGRYRLVDFGSGNAPEKGARKAYFGDLGQFVECKVYDRYALRSNTTIPGPALIEEKESTCVIGPSDVGTVDERLNIVINIGG